MGKESTCNAGDTAFDPWLRKMPWRRKQPPTPVCLPGESHGQRNLAGYSPRGHNDLDMTEVTYHTCTILAEVETVTDFIFLGSKITVNSVCSHEIKTRLLLGRKVTTNLESVLKSRDITLLTKDCIVKTMV